MSRPRGRPRDPEVDKAIQRAALDLFVDGGVEGTSIEQIAKRAGVGKLTVYRRWSSKEELIAQAIESARDELPWVSAEDLAEVSLSAQIERTLPGLASAMVESRFRAMVARIFGSSVSHPELMATYWEHYIIPRRRATHALLERAKGDGILNKDADTEALIDMMVGGVLYRLIQPGTPDATEMHRYLESVYRQVGLLD